MKRYLMISVLCLVACGAGASGEGDGDNASLSSPLSDGDDDAPEPDVALASSDGDDGAASDDVWQGADEGDADENAGACDDDSPALEDAPLLPSPGGPRVVVGAGGGEWTSPSHGSDGGSIVWCHASVPVGCGAGAPAPGAGRLVVVRGPAPGGEPVHVEAGVGAGVGAPSAGAGGGDIIVTPGPVDIFETEVAPGEAPVAIPVTVGGSLPPLPGTCVVITFQNLGESTAAAGDERAPLPPLPVLPPPGGCLDVAIEPGPGSVPVPPAAGGASVPGDVAPVPGEPPVVVPLPPLPVGAPPGACFSVAFAGDAAPGEGFDVPVTAPPLPAPPVICAAPGPRGVEPSPEPTRAATDPR